MYANILPAWFQFYSPGLSFSSTRERGIWNVNIKGDSTPVSQYLWEGGNLGCMSTSKPSGPNHREKRLQTKQHSVLQAPHWPTYHIVVQFFSTSSFQGLKTFPCFTSEELNSVSLSPLYYHRGGLVAKSCPTLVTPVDCSPPGSSVQGISQARILEWVAISFSKGSSWPR